MNDNVMLDSTKIKDSKDIQDALHNGKKSLTSIQITLIKDNARKEVNKNLGIYKKDLEY